MFLSNLLQMGDRAAKVDNVAQGPVQPQIENTAKDAKQSAQSTGRDRRPEQTTSSTVTHDTCIRGSLETKGKLRLEGTIVGDVTAAELFVAFDAFAEGALTAGEIIVEGRVKGPLHAKHVHLRSGAEVEGDITTTTVIIDTGAQVWGTVHQEKVGAQKRGHKISPLHRDASVRTASFRQSDGQPVLYAVPATNFEEMFADAAERMRKRR